MLYIIWSNCLMHFYFSLWNAFGCWNSSCSNAVPFFIAVEGFSSHFP